MIPKKPTEVVVGFGLVASIGFSTRSSSRFFVQQDFLFWGLGVDGRKMPMGWEDRNLCNLEHDV